MQETSFPTLYVLSNKLCSESLLYIVVHIWCLLNGNHTNFFIIDLTAAMHAVTSEHLGEQEREIKASQL